MEDTARLKYAPFGITTGFIFWTGNTYFNSAGAAYGANNTTGNIIQVTKTTSTNYRYIPVRIFSLSTSNILS